MKKKAATIRRMLSVIVLLFTAPYFASADDDVRPTYIIGVEQQPYAPYFYIEDGEYLGFAREFFDLFASGADIKFEYKSFAIDDLFAALKQGKIHFKFPDSPSWKYPKKMGVKWYYSDPVAPYIDGALVQATNRNIGIKSINRLGTIRGFTPWGYHHLIQYDKLKLKEADDIESLIGILFDDQVDAIYANVQVIIHHMRVNQPSSYSRITFNPNLPYTKHEYLVSTINESEAINKLNRFMEKEQKAVDLLKVKYGLHKVVDVLDRANSVNNK